jgi:hypothetical protein
MGGGDLNLKKAWHPATYKNQEKVWKREQQVLEEQRKLDIFKKEKAEERSREEMEFLRSGRKKPRVAKMDWMYAAGPNTSQNHIDEEKEAYLLGKKKITFDATPQAAESFNPTQSSIYGLSANNVKDIAAKVFNDPLLAIKKREQASLDAVLRNPLLVKKLKREKREKAPNDLNYADDYETTHKRTYRDRSSERYRNKSPDQSTRDNYQRNDSYRNKSPDRSSRENYRRNDSYRNKSPERGRNYESPERRDSRTYDRRKTPSIYRESPKIDRNAHLEQSSKDPSNSKTALLLKMTENAQKLQETRAANIKAEDIADANEFEIESKKRMRRLQSGDSFV